MVTQTKARPILFLAIALAICHSAILTSGCLLGREQARAQLYSILAQYPDVLQGLLGGGGMGGYGGGMGGFGGGMGGYGGMNGRFNQPGMPNYGQNGLPGQPGMPGFPQNNLPGQPGMQGFPQNGQTMPGMGSFG